MANLGWGSAVGKIFDWIPKKRESLQNRIDATKKEMENVINKTPFDSVHYCKLADKLRLLEQQEQRSS